jgi:hypothetical protein
MKKAPVKNLVKKLSVSILTPEKFVELLKDDFNVGIHHKTGEAYVETKDGNKTMIGFTNHGDRTIEVYASGGKTSLKGKIKSLIFGLFYLIPLGKKVKTIVPAAFELLESKCEVESSESFDATIKLKQLKQMLEETLITEEEYQTKKKELLALV